MTDTPLPLPRPAADPAQQPFWDAVARGRIAVQRCAACGNAYLPARHECPRCLSDDVHWEDANGAATLISWVVYHRAFNPAFAARLPYTVGIVELAEGARLISNIVGVDDAERDLTIDQPLELRIEDDGGLLVPRFAPAG